MSDEHDDYLWTGEGPVALELARIERELRPLAWRPRELPLPSPAAASGPPPGDAPILVAGSPTSRRASRPTRARSSAPRPSWVAPLVAGLIAAAAVLAVFVLGRQTSERRDATPEAQPAAPPSGRPSPRLRDPFSGTTPAPTKPVPGPARPPELVDPFAATPTPAPSKPEARPRPRPVVDPFAGAAEGPAQPEPAPAPASGSGPSPRRDDPDLVDPFKGERDAPSKADKAGDLVDPFGGKPKPPSAPDSGDLADPFKR